MSITLLLFTLCFGGVVSCKAQQNETTTKRYHVEQNKVYSHGEEITFKVLFNEYTYVLDPFQPEIQRFENGNWTKVSLLYCLCMPCPPPPRKLPVKKGKSWMFWWNQKEEFCEKNNRYPMRVQVAKGKYRLLIYFESEGEDNPVEIVQNFQIL